jgi:hypothetical protein
MERHESSITAVTLPEKQVLRSRSRSSAISRSAPRRDRKRITISQRFMLREILHQPSFGAAALQAVADLVKDRRANRPEVCSEPWFLRLERQVRRLQGDRKATRLWYDTAWSRLFSALRRSGPAGRS